MEANSAKKCGGLKAITFQQMVGHEDAGRRIRR
jgi:hypothetical protein